MNEHPTTEEHSEERMKILRLLRAGRITAEDASQLLDAIGEGHREPSAGAAPSPDPDPVSPGPSMPAGATPSAAGLVDEIKRVVDDVVRNIPKGSLDEVGDAIRESVREALREGRTAAREFRHWRHAGWGRHLGALFGSEPEAVAPFEDVRAMTAARLVIRNTRGDIRFSHSPDGQLHVHARRRVRSSDSHEAARLAERLPISVQERDDAVVIEGPGARPFHERIRVDFDIAVPDGLNIDAAVVRGDISSENPAGDVTVSVVKGDIAIEECARATVQATSGDITLRRCRGDTTVDVKRGDVAVGQAAGDLAVSTKRGDIVISADLVGRLQARTMHGDVSLRVRDLRSGGSSVISTMSGDVTFSLNPAARCRIDASTLAGDIHSRLPLGDMAWDRRRLSGVLNAPDAAVQISTSHGDITLQPLDAAVAQL